MPLHQAYMFVNVIDPVTDAVATGLDASAVALAASVGLVRETFWGSVFSD